LRALRPHEADIDIGSGDVKGGSFKADVLTGQQIHMRPFPCYVASCGKWQDFGFKAPPQHLLGSLHLASRSEYLEYEPGDTPTFGNMRYCDAFHLWRHECLLIVRRLVHHLRYNQYIRRFGSCFYSRLQVVGCHYTDSVVPTCYISGDDWDRTSDLPNINNWTVGVVLRVAYQPNVQLRVKWDSTEAIYRRH